MSISDDEVRRLARLAKLELSPEEEAVARRDLAAMLGYFEHLNAFDPPEDPGHEPDKTVRYRSDRVVPGLTAEQATSPAAEASPRGFRVPPVIDPDR